MPIQKQYNELILMEIQIEQKNNIFFILKEVKETVLYFSQETVHYNYFAFYLIQNDC